MSDIKDWPNLADDFNALPVPDTMPEDNTTVAQINDSYREGQAATRRYYESMEWRDFGYTISTNGAATVTFSAAVPLFVEDQRVNITHNTGQTVYGTITDNTAGTLTITVDGGVTLVTVTAVQAGFDPTGNPAAAVDVISTVTQGSAAPVESDGIYDAIAAASSNSIMSGYVSSVSAGSIVYGSFTSRDKSTTVGTVETPIPIDGTLAHLSTHVPSTGNTLSSVLVINIYINGAVIANSLNYSAGTSGSRERAYAFAVSEGDTIALRIDASTPSTGTLDHLNYSISISGNI